MKASAGNTGREIQCEWKEIRLAKHNVTKPIIGGWFAGDPKLYPMEHTEKLIWKNGGWYTKGALWFPTHFKELSL